MFTGYIFNTVLSIAYLIWKYPEKVCVSCDYYDELLANKIYFSCCKIYIDIKEFIKRDHEEILLDKYLLSYPKQLKNLI